MKKSLTSWNRGLALLALISGVVAVVVLPLSGIDETGMVGGLILMLLTLPAFGFWIGIVMLDRFTKEFLRKDPWEK